MSAHVLVLGSDATLRIRRGALEIRHSDGELRIDIDDAKPRAILIDGRGEFLTGDALRWMARYGVRLILPDGGGRMLTFVSAALECDGAQTLPDVGARLVRAQIAANPVRVAREIVRRKFVNSGLDSYSAHLNNCRSIAQIVAVEAHAALIYWRRFRDEGLREAKGGNLPRSWLRFANRNKGARFLGNRHAQHPVNAMLNYAYVVEAGRVAKHLAARGFCLQIGFLHCDKHGRNSLVWDTIELLRPTIDTKVFAFLKTREFSRMDFPQIGPNQFRISRAVISSMLGKISLADKQICESVDFVERLVLEGN